MWSLSAIVAGKLLLYWTCVHFFFRRIPFRRHADLPRPRSAFFSALLRLLLVIVVGVPLGILLLRREEWLVLAAFGFFRFSAWLASVWWYQRALPGVPVLFALVMTALNFCIDIAIMGEWLPASISHFRLC